MTGGAGQPPVVGSSSVEKELLRPREKRVRRNPDIEGDQASSDDSGDTDSWFASSSGEEEADHESKLPTVVPDRQVLLMPRPTTEIPIYWKIPEGEAARGCGVDLRTVMCCDGSMCLPPARTHRASASEEQTLNVRVAKLDTSKPTEERRGIESLDIHSLVDLHKQLERERDELPGELVVPGRVATTAVAMLVDSGATISVLSTHLWEVLRGENTGLSLLPSTCRVRTVSGELAPVRGRVVLEVELGGRYYVHQFTVMDVEESMILGMDFIQKYHVNCDWSRGVLNLKGEEVLACRRYSTGDGRVRKLLLAETSVVPAYTQVMVEAEICRGKPGSLPDWGMVSAARKPMVEHGVIAGKALVDPKCATIPVPVLNPGSTVVTLPRLALLAFMIPVEQVGPPMPRSGNTEEDGEAIPQHAKAAAQSVVTKTRTEPEVQRELDVLGIDLLRVDPTDLPVTEEEESSTRGAHGPMMMEEWEKEEPGVAPDSLSSALSASTPHSEGVTLTGLSDIQPSDFGVLEQDWCRHTKACGGESDRNRVSRAYCLHCAAAPDNARVRCTAVDDDVHSRTSALSVAPSLTCEEVYPSQGSDPMGQFYHKQWEVECRRG